MKKKTRRDCPGLWTSGSIYLGKMICTSDPLEAEQRDLAFKNKTAPPPPAFPHLTGGILRRTVQGHVQQGAGLLAPHVSVEGELTNGRLDEVVGLGFLLITTQLETSSLGGIRHTSADTRPGWSNRNQYADPNRREALPPGRSPEQAGAFARDRHGNHTSPRRRASLGCLQTAGRAPGIALPPHPRPLAS